MPTMLQQLPRTGRVVRAPQHTFRLAIRPWQLQPCVLAPVLPGETLKNALLQARVVTDPIRNALTGWWAEFYLFYVKLRDLDDRDTLSSMMLDLSTNVTALKAANADVPYYTFDDGMDWSRQCLKRVVQEYFRDEGEAWNTNLIDTLPVANINRSDWTDSLTDNAIVDNTTDNPPDDDDTPASEMESMRRTWEFMRQVNMSDMSFEDYLKTHGVRVAKTEAHRPELLRYVREWSYPANTINPTDGAPSSAVSWSLAERADKDRYFTEPGFIFGVFCVRPKVYSSSQSGSAAGLLDNALLWLPAIMDADPHIAVVKKAISEGPLQATTNPYWVDVRDIFIHGDQYVNFALTDVNSNLIGIPTAGLEKKYATGTMADALFKSASPANTIKVDGILRLSILGKQVDQT